MQKIYWTRHRKQVTRLLVITAILAVSISCAPDPRPQRAGARAVPVTVGTVTQQNLPVLLTAIGHAVAFETVAVKPQVTGQLVEVAFKEGQEVRKGQVLFRIDPRSYQDALNKSRSVLAQAQAQAAQAGQDEQRTQALVTQKLAPQEQLDTAHSSTVSLQAAVNADEAQVESDQLQLTYCTVISPIDGRTGDLQVDVGNIVQANTSVLVTINRLAPIFVSFSLPEQNLSDVKRYMAAGDLKVQATVTGEESTPVNGTLTFIDNTVDSTSGTFALKGTFGNTDRRLWPGQYVNVTLTVTNQSDAIVVPTASLQSGQNGQYVFVVKSDRTVEMRPVTVARQVGPVSAISAGVKPGETVVTDGQLLLVPGATADVKPAAAQGTQPPGTQSQGKQK
ncbi:MAG: efflux RND transporter periplasmic adaptor subunit [Spirochaetia bacterium]|jgi:multidrug efflux system membrane fusion protein